MRRLSSSALPLAILLLSATPILGQERSPELQRLNYFVGEWTFGEDGTQTCSWLGVSFIQCPSTWTNSAGNTVHALFVMGYDAETEVYVGFRFYGGGFTDSAMGWVYGNTWTWVYGDNPAYIIRFTGVEESETDWTYQWEVSSEGGPWEVTSGGRATKVR